MEVSWGIWVRGILFSVSITSGSGSFWVKSSFGSISHKLHPGKFAECFQIVPKIETSKRIGSDFEIALKILFSLLLSSCVVFLATLTSISSEFYLMWSSFFQGTVVLPKLPAQGCSFSLSLFTSTSFALSLKAAIWRSKQRDFEDWIQVYGFRKIKKR